MKSKIEFVLVCLAAVEVKWLTMMQWLEIIKWIKLSEDEYNQVLMALAEVGEIVQT